MHYFYVSIVSLVSSVEDLIINITDIIAVIVLF